MVVLVVAHVVGVPHWGRNLGAFGEAHKLALAVYAAHIKPFVMSEV